MTSTTPQPASAGPPHPDFGDEAPPVNACGFEHDLGRPEAAGAGGQGWWGTVK